MYLHVTDWPGNSLTIYGVKNQIRTAYLLADPGRKKLTVKQESKPALNYYSTTIKLPAAAPDKYDSVIVLQTAGAPSVIRTLSQQPGGGVTLNAYLGELHKAASDSKLAIDNLGTVRGWVDTNDWVAWDFNTFEPGTYEISVVTSARTRYNTAALTPWQGGQRVMCEVAGRQIRGALANDGRFSDPVDPMASYVVSKIGQVTIDKPGTQKLVLKTEDAELQKTLGLSLHSVKLAPAK
jgi:hypothetical protein